MHAAGSNPEDVLMSEHFYQDIITNASRVSLTLLTQLIASLLPYNSLLSHELLMVQLHECG